MITYQAIKENEKILTNSLFTHLECSHCGAYHSKEEAHTFCTREGCLNPLVAIYDTKTGLDRSILEERSPNMWRYREMLPVEFRQNIVSLGEGMTPLLNVTRLAQLAGLNELLIKNESLNPTGSFKARGLAMAVSKAKEFGLAECAIPTAGNAGSALSAYCARAGMRAHVYMPKKTPEIFKQDCQAFGARLTVVDGTISACGKKMKAENHHGQWFDVSTLKEPYRLEGKKTMGYEIAEQLNWQTPDVIVYPTGGGTGLIGIWKAFQEMLALGWIDEIKTRMVAVQVEGCSPIVDAFNAGQRSSEPFPNPAPTMANGLRVPHAFGHRMILNTLYQSQGTAIAVSEQEMREGVGDIARLEGLFVAPEGAAVWAAMRRLVRQGWIQEDETVVLLNTGSAYKYAENLK